MIILLLALLALAGHILAIPTIEAKGSKFFTSDGNQFYIKGIAYQLRPADPLVDTEQCKLDAALMKTLGANSIRVYHVKPELDHDGCMAAFADAGIYAWIDLDTFTTYILPNGKPPQWTQSQYQAYQKVMDTFHGYDNVAGFFVGNEMLTTGSDSKAAPYVKAAARDMKAYRDKKGYREIPIGYSAADIAALRPNLQNYLACGSDRSETLDFYSLNAYEWCGDSTYEVSGYKMLQQNASDYDIPIFMSETGCNNPAPRTFDDQSAIFGSEMVDTWSGSIVYEWIEETNDYGLISYGPQADPTATGADLYEGFTRAGTPTPISPDFDNLSKQWATLSPKGVSADAYTPTTSPPACPAYTSGMWELSGNVPLPTIGAKGASHLTASPKETPGGKQGSDSDSDSDSESGTSTSSGGTSSPTKDSAMGLGKREMSGFWTNFHNWTQDHPNLWYLFVALGFIITFCIGATLFLICIAQVM